MKSIVSVFAGLTLVVLSGFVGYEIGITDQSDAATHDTTRPSEEAIEWLDDSIRLPSLEEALAASGFIRHKKVALLAASLGIKGLEEHLVSALAVNPSYVSEETCKILFARYIELDPEGALAFAHDMISPVDRNYAGLMLNLYMNVALVDPDLAWLHVGLLEEPIRWEAKRRLITEVVTDDVRIAQYRADLTDEERAQLNRIELNRMSPQAAFQVALSLPDPNERRSGIYAALYNWAVVNPAEAFRNIPQDLVGRQSMAMHMGILQMWAQRDPAGALAAAITVQPSERYIPLVLKEFARTDIRGALQALNDQDWLSKPDFLTPVIGEWLIQDAAAATDFLDGLEGGVSSRMRVASIIRPWFDQDPDSAIEWLGTRSLEEHELMMLAYQPLARDPEGITRKIEAIEDGPVRTGLLRGLLHAKTSFESPRGAMEYLMQLGAKDIEKFHSEVLGQWASQDLNGAISYVHSVRDEKRRQQGLLSLIRSSSNQNYETAVGLLPEIDERYRDDALVALVQGSNHGVRGVRTPEWSETMALIDRIQNDTLRNRTLVDAITRVARTDKDHALELLGDHGLDDDEDLVSKINQL